MTGTGSDFLKRGNTVLDTRGLTLSCGDHVLRVTPSEGLILGAIMERQRVVSHEFLLDLLWNGRDDGPGSNLVRTHVCRIRCKLRAAGSDISLRNLFGQGYFLDAPEPPARVCAFSREQSEALTRCLGIARQTVPDLVALVEAADA